jgi:hypothetical protein
MPLKGLAAAGCEASNKTARTANAETRAVARVPADEGILIAVMRALFEGEDSPCQGYQLCVLNGETLKFSARPEVKEITREEAQSKSQSAT